MAAMQTKLSYRDAGVDIDAGEALVRRIAPLAARTHTPQVLGGLGGFSGLFQLPAGMQAPVLVAGTDGVGTKLRLAFELGRHDSIGIDLVAMCVNDIVTCGATPLFFLDYYACGHLDVDVATAVIRGITEGCSACGCALLGGESAEMPQSYPPGEYDLAGFAVGVVERAALLDGSRCQAGDVVLGLASSGLHANGFSLARAALFERGGFDVHTPMPEDGRHLGDVLLTPTKLYPAAVQQVQQSGGLKACAHITGGGLADNLVRVLPAGLGARLELDPARRPAIFDLIQNSGQIEEAEMQRTFNLGVGFVMVVDPAQSKAVEQALSDAGYDNWPLGTLTPHSDTVPSARIQIRAW
ncbi:MAG: phosphoribosylformylglycinamidine cyclo-ligase [Polyangiales bacterium]